MSDLEPLREYAVLEVWLTEAGDSGWKIQSNCNEEPDKEAIQHVLLELAEDLEDPDDRDPVLLTLMFHESGLVFSRWFLSQNFTEYRRWLWLRRRFYRAQWKVNGRDAEAGLGLQLLWSLSWLYHKVLGHFDARQKLLAAAATPAPATVTEMLYEHSEGLENSSGGTGAGAVVVPFKRTRK